MKMVDFDLFKKSLTDILTKNIYPSFLKKKSVIVFERYEDREVYGKNFHIEFFNENLLNTKIVEIFLSKHYNIICGSKNFFDRFYHLEVFFKYRTDIVMPFLSDDIDKNYIYKSYFNSFVYPENPYIERFYIMDQFSNTYIDKGILKNYKDFENLFFYRDNGFEMFFMKKGENKNFEIFTMPFYSIDKFLVFKKNDSLKFAYPKKCFERYIQKNCDGILNVSLEDENIILLDFYKNKKEYLQKEVKSLLEKFFEINSLRKKEFELNFKKIL